MKKSLLGIATVFVFGAALVPGASATPVGGIAGGSTVNAGFCPLGHNADGGCVGKGVAQQAAAGAAGGAAGGCVGALVAGPETCAAGAAAGAVAGAVESVVSGL
ncbi:hypothetical protein QDW14_08060 [Corynebacterium bovis]|uniref:hypothetical protein n=1 Tax=Corynebacterium bovis TaxID=36808 RepID=UPI00244C8943|nr:hypothetical protein [Corynebacterium bovis]MDH2456424.1 hypothetical protein [Corynebacterium bovis]